MDVSVYPGNYRKHANFENGYLDVEAKMIYSKDKGPVKKTVAFDLDETLGNFSDLFLLWVRIPMLDRTQLTFNRLLDLYPEFPRVGIFAVLQMLKMKILAGECRPIYLYTNNQCEPDSWVYFILAYFEIKTGVQFARPICAYKIGNRRVEPKRSTNAKTYADFAKCSNLQQPFELCFIDDRNHTGMRRSRVYYIRPPPYFHLMTRDDIEDRFNASEFGHQMSAAGVNYSAPTAEWKQQQQIITNKITYYLREFFSMSLLKRGKGRTKKRRQGFGTRRVHKS